MKRHVNRLSLYITPLIYLILTIYFAIELQLWEIAVVLVIFIAGRLIGRRLIKDTPVIRNKGKIHYNRHPVVFATWVIAIVVRISVEFFFNTQANIFIATCLLAAITGMIISETRFIHFKLNRRKAPRLETHQ